MALRWEYEDGTEYRAGQAPPPGATTTIEMPSVFRWQYEDGRDYVDVQAEKELRDLELRARSGALTPEEKIQWQQLTGQPAQPQQRPTPQQPMVQEPGPEGITLQRPGAAPATPPPQRPPIGKLPTFEQTQAGLTPELKPGADESRRRRNQEVPQARITEPPTRRKTRPWSPERPQPRPAPFDPNGEGYDYLSAQASGATPDEAGHWPSLDPRTGLVFKGLRHPTFSKTVKTEEKLGNVIIEGPDGRYYSRPRPPDELMGMEPEVKRQPPGLPRERPSEVSAGFLGHEIPPEARATQAETEEYNQYGRAATAVAKSIPAAVVQAPLGGGVQQLVESAQPYETPPLGEAIPVSPRGMARALGMPLPEADMTQHPLAQWGAKVYSNAEEAIKENQPKRMTAGPQFAYDTGMALVRMFPALATGAVAGPAAGLVQMAMQVRAEAYGRARKAGRSPEQASIDADITTITEVGSEILPMTWLFRRGTPLIKRVAELVVGEGAGEAANSLAQSLWEYATTNPDMTLADALRNAGYEGAIGAVMGVAMGGGAAVVSPTTTETGGEALPPPDGRIVEALATMPSASREKILDAMSPDIRPNVEARVNARLRAQGIPLAGEEATRLETQLRTEKDLDQKREEALGKLRRGEELSPDEDFLLADARNQQRLDEQIAQATEALRQRPKPMPTAEELAAMPVEEAGTEADIEEWYRQRAAEKTAEGVAEEGQELLDLTAQRTPQEKPPPAARLAPGPGRDMAARPGERTVPRWIEEERAETEDLSARAYAKAERTGVPRYLVDEMDLSTLRNFAADEPTPAMPPPTPEVAPESTTVPERGAEVGVPTVEEAETLYPTAGEVVDGRTVRPDVPTLSSLEASGFDAESQLPGVREVSMDLFTLDDAPPAKDQRTKDLAEEIRQSGEINPLIVGVDEKGPYIVEGAHRYDALKLLGAKSFPAVVAIETPTTTEEVPSAQGIRGNERPVYQGGAVTEGGEGKSGQNLQLQGEGPGEAAGNREAQGQEEVTWVNAGREARYTNEAAAKRRRTQLENEARKAKRPLPTYRIETRDGKTFLERAEVAPVAPEAPVEAPAPEAETTLQPREGYGTLSHGEWLTQRGMDEVGEPYGEAALQDPDLSRELFKQRVGDRLSLDPEQVEALFFRPEYTRAPAVAAAMGQRGGNVLEEADNFADLVRQDLVANPPGKPSRASLKVIDDAVASGATTQPVADLARWLLTNVDPNFDANSALQIANQARIYTAQQMREAGYEAEEGAEYDVLGATDSDAQTAAARTAVRLFLGHNADTVVHEWYHRFYDRLSAAEQALFDRYHQDTGDPSVPARERFADEGGAWFFSNKLHERAGTGILNLFSKARRGLRELVDRIRTIRGAQIPTEIEAIYRRAGTMPAPANVPGGGTPVTSTQARPIDESLAQGYTPEYGTSPSELNNAGSLLTETQAAQRLAGAVVVSYHKNKPQTSFSSRVRSVQTVEPGLQEARIEVTRGAAAGRETSLKYPTRSFSQFGSDTHDQASFDRQVAAINSVPRKERVASFEWKFGGAKLAGQPMAQNSRGCGRNLAILSAIDDGVLPAKMADDLNSCHGACYKNADPGAQSHGDPFGRIRYQAVAGDVEAARSLQDMASRHLGKTITDADLPVIRKGKTKQNSPAFKDMKQAYAKAPLATKKAIWAEVEALGFGGDWVPQEIQAVRVIPPDAVRKKIKGMREETFMRSINSESGFIRGNQQGDWLNEVAVGTWSAYAEAVLDRWSEITGKPKSEFPKQLSAVTSAWYVDVPMEMLQDIAEKYGPNGSVAPGLLLLQVTGPIDFSPGEAMLRIRGFDKLRRAGLAPVMRLITDEFGQGGASLNDPQSVTATLDYLVSSDISPAEVLETPLHIDEFGKAKNPKLIPKMTEYAQQLFDIPEDEAEIQAKAIIKRNTIFNAPGGQGKMNVGLSYDRLNELGISEALQNELRSRGYSHMMTREGKKIEGVFPHRCCTTGKCLSCGPNCMSRAGYLADIGDTQKLGDLQQKRNPTAAGVISFKVRKREPGKQETPRNKEESRGVIRGVQARLTQKQMRAPVVAPEGARLESADPEVEKRFKAAKGLGRESLLQKAQAAIDTARKDMFRASFATELDPKTDGQLIEILRQFEQVPTVSKAVAADRIARFVRPLDEGSYDIYGRNIILPDLQKDIDAGLYVPNEDGEWNLPFGYTPETLAEDIHNFKLVSDTNPHIAQAVAARNRYVRELAEDMVDAKLLDEKVLDDDRYFHHQVLAHMALNRIGASSKDVRLHRKGFQISRVGSMLDYNTEYAEAEFEWMAQAESQLRTARILERIKANQDIKPRLEAQAKQANLEAAHGGKENFARLQELRGQIRTLQESPDRNESYVRQQLAALHEEADALDVLKPYRIRMAIALGRVQKMASAGLLNDAPERFHDTISDLIISKEMAEEDGDVDATPYTSGDLMGLLGWLAKQEGERAMPARMFWKAVGERKAAVRTLAGDQFKTWKDYVPEGYVPWQPKQGNQFYRTMTVPERIATQILEQGVADVTKEDLREVLAIAGALPQWVVPERVATSLDNFRDFKEDPIVGKGVEYLQNKWKQWVLFMPLRVARYLFNNFTGDADITMASYPGAFKEAPQAAVDLWRYFMQKQELTPELEDAMEKGVIDSGITTHEIPDIKAADVLKHLRLEQNVSTVEDAQRLVGKYWKTVKDFNAWREAVLRLAMYRYLQKRGGKYYGASKATEVDMISDPKERAAKVSREILGDYGAVSAFGVWMAKKAVPFWRWQEINSPRYVRLWQNLPAETETSTVGRTAGLGAAAAIKAAKMASLYAGVSLWNWLLFPDEEKEMGKSGRHQLHLIVGRDKDNEIKSVRMQGALSDALSWIALEDLPGDVADLMSGEKTVSEQLWEMLTAAPEKLFQSAAPLPRLAFEVVSGRKTYPSMITDRPPKSFSLDDMFESMPIRDRGEHIARTFSLDMPYRYLAGKPTRGLFDEISKAVIYRTDAGERAYYEIKDKVRRYLEDNGLDRPAMEPDARRNALYYARQAIKWGDRVAAEKYLNEYQEAGGTVEGIERSIERMDPLAGLSGHGGGQMGNEVRQRDFIRSLTPSERELLRRAFDWYERVYLSKENMPPKDQGLWERITR